MYRHKVQFPKLSAASSRLYSYNYYFQCMGVVNFLQFLFFFRFNHLTEMKYWSRICKWSFFNFLFYWTWTAGRSHSVRENRGEGVLTFLTRWATFIAPKLRGSFLISFLLFAGQWRSWTTSSENRTGPRKKKRKEIRSTEKNNKEI